MFQCSSNLAFSDEADALLALLGRVDQRGNEQGLVTGAVHRGLEAEDVAILRRAADERLEARREGLVGMVDENVAASDLLEELRRPS